jgi:hypothetical protein
VNNHSVARAAATKLSKSSVHRLYHRLLRRNQYPESQLWETEAGQQGLRLLVFAAVFVFALQGGIGCERLSEFFHLLRLERHIGVSPSALRRLRTCMEEKILEYQQKQQAQTKLTRIVLSASVLLYTLLPLLIVLLKRLFKFRPYSNKRFIG